jgi:hypothetical protein
MIRARQRGPCQFRELPSLQLMLHRISPHCHCWRACMGTRGMHPASGGGERWESKAGESARDSKAQMGPYASMTPRLAQSSDWNKVTIGWRQGRLLPYAA